MEFSSAEKESANEEKILDLVRIRASQMSGYGFCLDMHLKQAMNHGESKLRLNLLPIWRESTLFLPRIRYKERSPVVPGSPFSSRTVITLVH
jgi:AhpD family alkylhydroperoxidase